MIPPEGVKFKGRWDGALRVMIIQLAVMTALPVLFGAGMWAALIGVSAFLFIVVMLKSVYYRVTPDTLIIYRWFLSRRFHISRIVSIAPTSDLSSGGSQLLSAATAISGRYAITLEGNTVGRTKRILVSHEHPERFIATLLEANPQIKAK